MVRSPQRTSSRSASQVDRSRAPSRGQLGRAHNALPLFSSLGCMRASVAVMSIPLMVLHPCSALAESLAGRPDFFSTRTERLPDVSASPQPNDLRKEMSLAIWEIGGPIGYGENLSSVLGRAAKEAGITWRMAKALFYRERRNPGGLAVDGVRAARDRIRAERQAARIRQDKLREETARAQAERTIDRLAGSIETALRSPDADEVRDLLITLRERIARMRGMDCAMDIRGSEMAERVR